MVVDVKIQIKPQMNKFPSKFIIFLLMFGCTSLYAQVYPSASIRMVVPFAPGTATDIVARLISEGLTQELKVPVIVDNRLGASGVVGADYVSKAPADGYTLLFTSPAHYLNTSLYKKLPYDAVKDFRPVTKIANAQLVLIVPKTSSFNTAKDLIAAAKLRPSFLTYSSAGNGSTTQLCSALFNAMSGINLTHVPYKSGGQALVDLIGGQVNTTFTAVATALPHIKSGSVKALGVSGLVRSSSLPEIPTISEAAIADYELVSWSGVLVRVETSDSIVNKLNIALVKIASRADFQTKLNALGIDMDLMPTDVFSAKLSEEIPKWARIASTAGVISE